MCRSGRPGRLMPAFARAVCSGCKPAAHTPQAALHCFLRHFAYETPPMTQAPKIGLVSLGCPKALVDSERIMTTLRAQGYAFSRDYAGADIVLVNTCGFLDSAKQES